MNRIGSELLGQLPAGLTLKEYERYWTVDYPDGRNVPLAERPMARALAGETVRNQEYRFILADGLVRYVLVNAGPLRSTDGAIFAGAVIFSDITERKQTEEALKRAIEWQEAIIEGSGDATFISDSDSRLIAVNSAASKLTGYSRDELLRIHIPDLHQDADLAAYRQYHGRIMAGEEIVSEAKILRKDGAKVDAEFNSRRMEVSGVQYMHTVARDVSQRKRAEEVQAATYRISEAANSAETLQALYCLIHDTVGELMPADNFYIALYAPDSETLSFPYFVDEHRKDVEPRKLRRGLTEYVLRTGVPLRATPAVLQELIDRGEAELIGAWPVDWLGVPLQTKEKTIGVLVVQSYKEGVLLSDEDKDVLVFVSTQVAIAIERKRAEAALRESEDRYRDLVEHTSDLMCTHDLDGLILSVNQGAAKLFGVDPGDIVSRNLREIVAPEFRFEVDEYLNKIRTEGVAEGLTTFMTASGERRILEFHNTLRTEGVATPIVRGMARDVTERKRVQDALRISERKYKDVFEMAPVGIYQSRHDGSLLTANFALASMLGYDSVDDLLCVNLAENVYLDKEERERLIRVYEPVGSARDIELQWKRKDGTPIWVNLNAQAVKNHGGTLYFEGFVRDIDARRQAQDALRESERRFSKAFQASPDSITITKLPEGRFIDTNERFLHVFGYSREEVIGRTGTELNIFAKVEDRARMVGLLVEQGAIRDFEADFRKKSGEVIVGLMSAEVIDLGGERCVLAVTRDITERKRAEEERKALLASERVARITAEQANRLSAELLIREQSSRVEAEAARREWQTTLTR